MTYRIECRWPKFDYATLSYGDTWHEWQPWSRVYASAEERDNALAYLTRLPRIFEVRAAQ